VVTGGTAARNIVSKKSRKLLFPWRVKGFEQRNCRCGRIPVIGIVNDRPNGPCYNTNVDVDAIRNKLESIINEKE